MRRLVLSLLVPATAMLPCQAAIVCQGTVDGTEFLHQLRHVQGVLTTNREDCHFDNVDRQIVSGPRDDCEVTINGTKALRGGWQLSAVEGAGKITPPVRVAMGVWTFNARVDSSLVDFTWNAQPAAGAANAMGSRFPSPMW
jgi:hypothetical protein